MSKKSVASPQNAPQKEVPLTVQVANAALAQGLTTVDHLLIEALDQLKDARNKVATLEAQLQAYASFQTEVLDRLRRIEQGSACRAPGTRRRVD